MNDSFEEILILLNIWINEGSGWVIDEIKGLYINISNYEPLLGGSYISLPKALNNSMKDLINLKNKDHKCFMQCHVRLMNPQTRNAERINKQDKKIAANLNYLDIAFPLDINDYEKTEDRFQMQVNVFGYENEVYLLYTSKRSYNQTLNLLLITKKEKAHYIFIKDFDKFMFSRTKHKGKKHYCMSSLQSFTTEEILSNHKQQCLLINGCQAENYESGIIKFTNHNKKIPILFKIYANAEYFFKKTKIEEGEIQQNIKNITLIL